MRRFLFLSVPVLCAVLGAVSPAAAMDDAREPAVLEAALRQQIGEQLDASERARGTVVCLGVEGDVDAGAGLVARFSSDKAVRRLADCERRPDGAIEIATAKAAIIVTAGPLEWIATDEAWVTVSYYRTRVLSAPRRYRVVRERDGWVSLGPIVKDAPA